MTVIGFGKNGEILYQDPGGKIRFGFSRASITGTPDSRVALDLLKTLDDSQYRANTVGLLDPLPARPKS